MILREREPTRDIITDCQLSQTKQRSTDDFSSGDDCSSGELVIPLLVQWCNLKRATAQKMKKKE